MKNDTTFPQEALFLNTRLFEFPQNGLTMYFTDVDNKDIALSPLTSYYPVGIEQCFPSIQKDQTIYTSFTRKIEGFRPLTINFKDPNNFFFVKRYYNHEIKHYFRKRGFLVDETFIKDTDVYIKIRTESKDNFTYEVYNRFNIKVNFSHIHNKPELVISYGRTMMVMRDSIQDVLNQYACNQPICGSAPLFPTEEIRKTVEVIPMDDGSKRFRQRIVNIKKLEKQNEENKRRGLPISNVNYQQHHIILNRALKTFFHIDSSKDSHDFLPTNRYTRFIPLITDFINQYLNTDEFRKIIPLAEDYTAVTAGTIKSEAMNLYFGNNTTHKKPQLGLNNGPYLQPNYYNILLFFIFPKNRLPIAQHIYKCFTQGYGKNNSKFEGISKYLGVQVQTKPGFSIMYDTESPTIFEDISSELDRKREDFSSPNTLFLCMYLSPYNKHNNDDVKHELYYKIKEKLLRYKVPSQCVDIEKYVSQKAADERSGRFNLTYTLQNMAVAINAKLGGQPWIIATPPQREFIIGVGAFRTADSDTPYIGAAFVFNNTGAFNKYTYFQNKKLSLLIGAIEEEIINYRNTFQNPSRIIIHYYKVMREEESQKIENMLQNLELNIPVYIVTINETESEDIFVFDSMCNEKIPQSGRYVSLGNYTYLLCNNTRYGTDAPRPADGYPFPIKIRLNCRGIEATSQTDIEHLIEQVYQFSRIYWKSVRQQNLPVTIMYPKMIAEIMPHFEQQGVTQYLLPDCLWFL